MDYQYYLGPMTPCKRDEANILAVRIAPEEQGLDFDCWRAISLEHRGRVLELLSNKYFLVKRFMFAEEEEFKKKRNWGSHPEARKAMQEREKYEDYIETLVSLAQE